MELFNQEVAIITGAAQGIGKAIATTFAKEGARPILFDVNAKKGLAAVQEINDLGYFATFIQCDVSSKKDIERAVEQAVAQCGDIDILVNNAGILHSTEIEDITEEEWNKILSVNLSGVFFMCQQVIPTMKKNNRGSIINLSSLAGRMGGLKNGLAYSATKSGVIGLTYGLATRLAKFNINVNCVAPGPTETDILLTFTEEKRKDLAQSIPLQRFGTPEDIANTVAFLASKRSSFATGAVLDVNGGSFVG